MAAQTSSESFPKPSTITGGCLCGAIRYQVDFPEDHDFLDKSHSCQCTQCRRQSGTLVFYAHLVPRSGLRYLTATDTLRDYEATPGIQRGFCARCGSWLYWRDAQSPNVALTVGTIDPRFLLGGRRAAAAGEDDGGDPDGPDYGYALANCRGGNVFRDASTVCRVTDGVVGEQ